ncbi:class I SAM-dependent methyltransferase [Salidesulfovibrio onnuriiensis]|uniref:class I SAM-dependent methyltransferase n=1 Tax=Salidesulfovibrio onnuriiensis TaxID=2583823 RepID=UPI0011CBB292|nr:class I SAM-dependent methyltransferase [Salidesulfovibrio onnuriiensis]
MLKKFFSKQARKPSGFFGRFITLKVFEKGNAGLNRRMLELVSASGGDRILEIGFGGGGTIYEMACALDTGSVEGIDFSDAMLKAARRKNREHIAAGTVTLLQGDFDSAHYPPCVFDTVCTANTIYFWPDRKHTASRIHEVLKPGGRLVLAYVDRSKMDNMPLDMEVFTPISRDEVRVLLEEAGFREVRFHPCADPSRAEYCVEAFK